MDWEGDLFFTHLAQIFFDLRNEASSYTNPKYGTNKLLW